MNIEGNWTTGSHRILRELVKELKKDEDDRIDLSADHRGTPHLMVRDMTTGASIELKGRYLRRADYTQRIKQPHPEHLMEGLLLSVIEDGMKEWSDSRRRSFWGEMRSWIGNKLNPDTWHTWVEHHDDRIQTLNKLLDKHLKYEHKRQSGHTLIEMEDVVESRHATVNPDILDDTFIEGWEEPQEEEEWTL